jgi:hypothetical protein
MSRPPKMCPEIAQDSRCLRSISSTKRTGKTTASEIACEGSSEKRIGTEFLQPENGYRSCSFGLLWALNLTAFNY